MRVWLLPGLDGTGDLFGPLIEALAGIDVEIVRYARDAARYDALLAGLAPPAEPTVLVAESFSGPIAIRLASTCAHVRALVLVASFARGPRLARWLGPLVAHGPRPPRPALRLAMLGLDAPRARVDELASAIASVPPSVLASRIDEVARVDVRAELASLTIPVTWIVARRDRLVGAPENEIGRRVVVDGPHLLAQVRPHAVADVVRAELRARA